VAADDPSLPDTWGPSQNIAWKIDVPGRSWSSPVVWGDHVFVTTAVNTAEVETLLPVAAYVSRSNGGTSTFRDLATPAPHRWVLYDIDFKTGKIRWERQVASGVPSQPRHVKNSYATETPGHRRSRVYAYFAYVGLFAFDMNASRSGPPMAPQDAHRSGSASPVLHGDRIYILNDNDEQSFIAAFNAATGDEVWRVNRKEAPTGRRRSRGRTTGAPRS
jgi:outer membrane protein assembly factor BamB